MLGKKLGLLLINTANLYKSKYLEADITIYRAIHNIWGTTVKTDKSRLRVVVLTNILLKKYKIKHGIGSENPTHNV